MDKKTIIIIAAPVLALIVALAVAGYLWWKASTKNNNFGNMGQEMQNVLDKATKGVLPSINTNPLADKPNINPAENANPIKNIKTNPFE